MKLIYSFFKLIMSLSYDIIYNIYFYLDDYSTINKFWILSKYFNKNYMTRYNKTYIHKYKILYNNFFIYLQYLDLQGVNITTPTFFAYVSAQRLNKRDSKILINDIFFIYNLYKQYIINILPERKHRLLNKILSRGPNYLDRIFTLTFNKNNIDIKIKYLIPLIKITSIAF
jgi:hypothetical protein